MEKMIDQHSKIHYIVDYKQFWKANPTLFLRPAPGNTTMED